MLLQNLNCKFKRFGLNWISGISIRYFKGTHTVQIPRLYYFIPPSNKTSRKKHVSKKSTFYHIVILVFKLDTLKHIFEYGELHLNLNSMR